MVTSEFIPKAITVVAVVITLALAPSWRLGSQSAATVSDAVKQAALRDLEGQSYIDGMLEPSETEEAAPVRAGEVARFVVERSDDYRRRMLDVLRTHYGARVPERTQSPDFLSEAVEEQIRTKTMLLLSSTARARSKEELSRVVERTEACFPAATAEL